ncbi:unnamed protein product [Urochloa decumbens]|uniref:Uncharacterized protein n=1 Tax=Urochloa decumbens TaxID=240449 RepID=A0ABC9FJ13_9POAL
MEKGGQQVNENRHDLYRNIGNDYQEDVVEDHLGDEGYSDAHTDPEDEDYVPGRKQSKAPVKHKRLPPHLVQELITAYEQCTHPDANTRQEIAARLDLHPKQVKIWFQNRRSQMPKKAQVKENKEIQQDNASLQSENQSLRQAMMTQSCITCGSKTLPSDPLSEKQRLLIENGRLKDEYLRATAAHSKTIHTSALAGPAPPLIIGSGADREALRRHADASMEQFLVLATKGEPVWIPTTDGDMLDNNYGATMSSFLFGLRPKGFAVEATRDTAMVWGTSADLVGILMDTTRWSEMFPGIVASVTAGDFVSTGIFASCDRQIQLMNAKLWVQSPRVSNRTVNILRFSKLVDEKQWAVMDVSVDGVLGQEEVSPSRYMGCRLLPSGCVIEDMNNGYCKVTWIVHAEYDETTLPMMFKPLFRAGQALGARRWLASLQRQREYAAALLSSRDPVNNNTAETAILKLAQHMMATFYTSVSGPFIQTQATSNTSEWVGSIGTGIERCDATVRMVTLKKTSTVAGESDTLFLCATTTLWLRGILPESVFSYLRNEQLRAEWDMLANGAPVELLRYIATGYPVGNAVSVLRSNYTDGTNNKILILQETCTDSSGSLVVFAPIGEESMYAAMNSGDNTSLSFLTSGFAILPDGRGNARHDLATAPSTSRAPACSSNTGGSLLTMAYQVMLPSSPPDNAVDEMGKFICHVVEKIKIAVKADIMLPV